MEYSKQTTISTFSKTPFGKDVIDRILSAQNVLDSRAVNIPFVKNLTLEKAFKLARLDDAFLESLLLILNQDSDVVMPDEAAGTQESGAQEPGAQDAHSQPKPLAKPQKTWWKEAVIYQIYPRSFKDSNGDGIGDLQGIIEKLDYLQDLGVSAIWLSPIYDSPNDDNGYDIRDYRKIMTEFGSMDDFNTLLDETHKRGMRLIMDLVVNHTSDEHEWYQKALADKNSPYRDYYFFKKTTDGNPPNNWESFFSGSAWNLVEGEVGSSESSEGSAEGAGEPDGASGAGGDACADAGIDVGGVPEPDGAGLGDVGEGVGKPESTEKTWALHLFTKKQMDLNWENEEVQREVVDIVNFWLEKGVDGFRMDVINLISKNTAFPDGAENFVTKAAHIGFEHYFYGKNLHKYLRELQEKAFSPYRAFSVGETPGIGNEQAKLLIGDYRHEIDTLFNFEHLASGGHTKFDNYKYDLNHLKNHYINMLGGTPDNYWQSIFIENHDQPRFISKVSNNPEYRDKIGKLLALIELTTKGAVFIYQGQELGMVNQDFSDLSDFRDVESINLYNELVDKGVSTDEALATLRRGSRDHSRTPMQWDDTAYAGFTSGKPWIFGSHDYKKVNVKSASKDKLSVLNFYKTLIALRKKHPELVYGDIEFVLPDKKNYFVYKRFGNGSTGEGSDASEAGGEAACKEFLVEINLADKRIKRSISLKGYKGVLSNYQAHERKHLEPYEANLYVRKI